MQSRSKWIRLKDPCTLPKLGLAVRASDSQTQKPNAQEPRDDQPQPENATGSLSSSDSLVTNQNDGREKKQSAIFLLTEADFQDFGGPNAADAGSAEADSDPPAAVVERVLPSEWYLRPWVVPWGARETGIGIGAWLTR